MRRSPLPSEPAIHHRGPLVIALVGLAALLVGGCADETPRPLSVLLISADSLRTDRLPPWNPDDAPPMPHLEALTARGTRYANAFATSPWTAPSMVSVFTGLYPPSHGVAYRDDTTPPGLPTLSRMLGDAGYPLGNFSFFSQISYFRNLGLGKARRGLTHATVAKSFNAWLGRQPEDEPYFAWLHLLEPHLPYGATGYRATEVKVKGSSGLEKSQLDATVPVGTATFRPRDAFRLMRLYDRDVKALDRTLGRIHAALERYGRLDDTIVVFVADHGEELLDHGWVGHASTAIEAHLWPEIMHIPLIIAGPGIPAGQVRDELVQQVDILPSVLRLLRRPLPDPVDGQVLPGLGLERRWPWRARPRSMAFFDSSPGGNLTPQDQRGQRVQGATDGQCLIEETIRPGRATEKRIIALDGRGEIETCATTEALTSALDRWRADQTKQRLALLTRKPERTPPDPAVVEAYAERLAIVEPRPDTTVRWQDGRGQLALAWDDGTGSSETDVEEGSSGRYWLEYRLTGGFGIVADVEGAFPLDQRRVVFGPVPQGFWNDLAAYSPFHVRVVDEAAETRSPWTTFEVEAVR